MRQIFNIYRRDNASDKGIYPEHPKHKTAVFGFFIVFYDNQNYHRHNKIKNYEKPAASSKGVKRAYKYRLSVLYTSQLSVGSYNQEFYQG